MQNKEPSDSSTAKSLLHLTFWTRGPQNEGERCSEAHIPFILWERTCCIPGWNVWSLDRPLGVISATAGLQVSVDQWQNKIVALRVSTMLTYGEASLLQSIADGAGRYWLAKGQTCQTQLSPLRVPSSEEHFLLALSQDLVLRETK